jgi:uncharacterized membrane protein
MKLDDSPFFRKAVTPWHDSDLFCMVICVLSAAVFVFARIGFGFAQAHERYQPYGWIPLVLMALSAMILASSAIRLIVRLVKRYREREEEI